jgi:D-alanyl-D-alanine carboxypeptidase/D-alanyl-D-alanine-endopeptidase (penicillin-binding protein 4)
VICLSAYGGSRAVLFHGDVMSGQTPQSLSPLKIYQSPPLADIIRGINKFSNNIAARQLYLTLGIGDVVINNSPATLAKSEVAIRQWLEEQTTQLSGIGRGKRLRVIA